MKIKSKKNLKWENGKIYNKKKSKTFQANADILNTLSDLDLWIRKAKYYREKSEKLMKLHKVESMAFDPYAEKEYTKLTSKFPLLEKKVEESKALAKELDAKATTNKVQAFLKEFDNVFKWLDSDDIEVTKDINNIALEWEFYHYKNPLKLTSKEVIDDLLEYIDDMELAKQAGI